MTQKKTDNRRIVSGRNIYIDDKGQAVLYDKKTKIGYVIKESDAESYRLYQNRIAISIAVFMLLTSFLNDWKLPLIAGVILAALLEVRYRRWLPTLTKRTKFRPEKNKTFLQGVIESNDSGRCILLGFLYIIFGILLVANGFVSDQPLFAIICEFGVLAYCLYMGITYFYAVSKMKH